MVHSRAMTTSSCLSVRACSTFVPSTQDDFDTMRVLVTSRLAWVYQISTFFLITYYRGHLEGVQAPYQP